MAEMVLWDAAPEAVTVPPVPLERYLLLQGRRSEVRPGVVSLCAGTQAFSALSHDVLTALAGAHTRAS